MARAKGTRLERSGAKRGRSPDAESSSTNEDPNVRRDKRVHIDSESREDSAKSDLAEIQTDGQAGATTTSASHPDSTTLSASTAPSSPVQPSGTSVLGNDTAYQEDLDTHRVPTLTQVPQKQNVTRPYTFHIGASWAAKPAYRPVPSNSDTVIGSWKDRMLTRKPAVISMNKGGHPGEDFFFVQQMRNQSGMSFGVADGVGNWSNVGVDPSLFSQAIMYYAHEHLCSAWPGEPEIDPTLDNEEIEGREMTPYECLDLAYADVLREKDVQAGSSTACIITLDASSGVLRCANLGDSGYMIIRSNSIFSQSCPQSHSFNCPKQLAKWDKSTIKDPPSHADTYKVQLRDGDIVIAYTDGLSDNVFPSEIVTTIRSLAQAGGTEDEQVQNMADSLVDYAQQGMNTWARLTPFESEARMKLYSSGYSQCRGGKPDDVTVVVGRIRVNETL